MSECGLCADQRGDMSGDHQDQEVVLTRLTNNWAGVEPGKRQGLLPPIKHKLHTAVQNFPVIPPISSETETSDPGTTVGRSRVQEVDIASRLQRNIRTRNSHLRKVYLVSLTQLLLVLLIVVVFTEVDAVRDFNNRHPWFGVVLTGKPSVQYFSNNWLLCFSPDVDIPLFLDNDSYLFPISQAANLLQRIHPANIHSVRGVVIW